MANTTVHIIEPTLASQAGHCYAYCQSLIGVDDELNLHLWINHKGRALFDKQPVHCHGYFSRRLRKLQIYFLYKKLLKTDDTLFVPTAGRTDMVMLDRLLSKRSSQARIVLHFHQFSRSEKKLRLLNDLAKKHPNWIILTPTKRLSQLFIDNGFKHCHVTPCPGYTPHCQSRAEPFRYALYGGAVRNDKGFSTVVNTIAYCQQQLIEIPFYLQTSAPKSDRFDEPSEQAMERLQHLESSLLKTNSETPDQQQYLHQFTGSICLQAYNTKQYHDKFSAVTLDAICMGAPIVTGAGTWIADTVTEYDAGIVINDYLPETLAAAINTIISDYSHYQQNCFNAAAELIEQHHSKHTLARLKAPYS